MECVLCIIYTYSIYYDLFVSENEWKRGIPSKMLSNHWSWEYFQTNQIWGNEGIQFWWNGICMGMLKYGARTVWKAIYAFSSWGRAGTHQWHTYSILPRRVNSGPDVCWTPNLILIYPISPTAMHDDWSWEVGVACPGCGVLPERWRAFRWHSGFGRAIPRVSTSSSIPSGGRIQSGGNKFLQWKRS